MTKESKELIIEMINLEIEYYKAISVTDGEGEIPEYDNGFLYGMAHIKKMIEEKI